MKPVGNQRMKLTHCFFCMAIVLAAAGAAAQAPDLSRMDVVERSVPDGPVAMVDGSPVSNEDFLYLYQTQLALVSGGGQQPPDDRTRVEIALYALRELLQREVLYNEARRRGLTVTEEALDANYARRLSALQERWAAKGEGSRTEAEILAESGQTREEARASMRKLMLINQAFDAIIRESNIEVGDAEVESFYRASMELFERPNRVHLRQIFVRPKMAGRAPDEAAWEEARARIDRARARIRAGESFESVARSASEAPGRDQGGDMGSVPIDALPPFYAEPVSRMKPGEISDIIRSPHGFHIIQLVSREESDTAPLEEVREDIRRILRENKADEILERFCEPILSDAHRTRVFLHLDPALLAAANPSPASGAVSKANATPGGKEATPGDKEATPGGKEATPGGKEAASAGKEAASAGKEAAPKGRRSQSGAKKR